MPFQASLVCPCAESEKQCNVVDYTSSGKQTNTSVQCINKGAKCPCGANSLVCPDPNNAEENICRPKYAGTVLNSCPKASHKVQMRVSYISFFANCSVGVCSKLVSTPASGCAQRSLQCQGDVGSWYLRVLVGMAEP